MGTSGVLWVVATSDPLPGKQMGEEEEVHTVGQGYDSHKGED